MEFTFETAYDRNALTAMARGLRKTVRKKHSRRSHVLGWIIIVLALFLAFLSGPFDFRAVVTLIAALVMIAVLCFEDRLNGYFAGKRMLPGTQHASSRFADASFTSATEVGSTEFYYDKIIALAESRDYFIFLFSNNHAQVYDKRTLSGGSIDEFRSFITEKAQTQILSI